MFSTSAFENFSTWLSEPLFSLGQSKFSLGTVVYVFLSLVLLVFLSRVLRNQVKKRLLSKPLSRTAHLHNLVSFVYYLSIATGTIIILQSAGFDFSAVAVLAGALGIGLGFGLQNLANNFISGVIILFERPIKMGDRIEVGKVMGQVEEISMRATKILTNDNVSIIVPNSEFISSQVINWSHTDEIVRLRFPIGVSYSADPHKVKTVLEEAISKHPGILKNRRHDVILDSFGDSSLNFVVRIWTQDYAKRPGALRSEINFIIWDALKENAIEIPFPQLDLHVKSNPQS